MSAERRVVYLGKLFTIAFARDRSGIFPAEEFFDRLPKSDQEKLMHLFLILGDHDKHTNPEKFGDLGGKLFEFKSGQIRMPYAYASYEKRLILIASGFIKKKNKADPTEIIRARKILQEDAKSAKVCIITDPKRTRRP